MGIDSSIALSYRAPQIENPVNQLARVLQVQGLQQEQETARRALEDQNALRSALSAPNADPYNALLKLGRVKEANDYAKGKADVAKSNAAADKDSVETEHKAIGIYRDASQAIADPQGAVAFVTTMHGDPRLKNSAIARVPLEQLLSQIPQDPAQLPAWKQQFALGATKFMELNKPQFVTSNLGGKTVTNAVAGLTGEVRPVNEMQNTQSPDSAASIAQQERNSLRVDARAREAAELQRNQPRGQFLETPEGYVLADPKSGKTAPVLGADGKQIQGKAADKALTEGQAKANLFGTRMQEANKVLESMAKQGVQRPGVIKGAAEATGNIMGLGTESMGGALSDAAGSLTNWTQSTEQQQVEQAQRDFINAVLRRESGASIAPHEFRNANKQYFPQPNDDPPTLAQKARNRQVAIDGMLAEVPEAKRSKVAPAAETPPKWADDKEARYQAWKKAQQ